MLRRLFNFSHGHPWVILGSVATLTAAVSFFALRVKVDVSYDALVPAQSSKLPGYHKSTELFGSDTLAAIYVEDPGLFSVFKLAKLQAINNELAQLRGVQKVESLFTINNIRNEGGAIDTSPLLDSIPKTPEDILEKKRHALGNPLIAQKLLSSDGQATAITLYLDGSGLGPHFSRGIHREIESILQRHGASFTKAFQVGTPFTEAEMMSYLVNDQIYLLPISALVLLLFIGYSLGSYSSAIIPLANSLVSTVWTAAAMYWLGLQVNFLTYIIPALMIVIGSLEDIHLVASYIEARHETGSSSAAIDSMAKRLGMIMLCTSSTTVIGFGANALTDLPIMFSFGVASAIAMTFNFLATITMVPACLRLMGNRLAKLSEKHGGSPDSLVARFSRRLAEGILGTILARPRQTCIIFGVLLIPAIALIFRIQLNNDLLSFFRPDSPMVVRNNLVHKKLCGARTICVQLLKDPGDFRLSHNLVTMEKIAAYLRTIGEFDSVTGLTDYLALVNREMHEGRESFYKVPETDGLVAQYLLLFQRRDLERYVSADYSSVNLVIRHNINSSTRLNELLDRISREIASGRHGSTAFRITGKDVLIADGVESIAMGQVSSMSLDVAIIFLLMAGVFLSWKAGVLSMIPNLVPITFIFAVMGLCHIPLNIGTSMVGAICLGIAVDDTIHFMITYNQHLKRLGDERAALRETLVGETLPVLVSALALTAGFFVLGFSSFLPVAQFGQLSGLVMIMAIITDLLLTPILLSSVRLITVWEAVSLKYQENVLRTCLLFKDMRRWQIKRLVLMSNLLEFPPNYRLITEGNEGECMFVILKGELSVLKVANGKEHAISKLKAGDIVGEIAAICKEKRTASVVTDTWVTLLAVDWASLEKLRRWLPHVSATFFLNITRIVGNRLIRLAEQTRSIEPEHSPKAGARRTAIYPAGPESSQEQDLGKKH